MRCFFFTLAVAVVVLLLGTANAVAKTETSYFLRVEVVAGNGRCDGEVSPVAGARITLFGSDGSIASKGVTGEDGVLYFPARGQVRVEIEYPAGVLPCSPVRLFVSPPPYQSEADPTIGGFPQPPHRNFGFINIQFRGMRR